MSLNSGLSKKKSCEFWKAIDQCDRGTSSRVCQFVVPQENFGEHTCAGAISQDRSSSSLATSSSKGEHRAFVETTASG